MTSCDFYSGWIAGCAGLVVGHPIDTIKVRQQIIGKPLGEHIRTVYNTGGVLTFFRGMGVPLVLNGAMNSIFFGFYGSAVDYFTFRRQNTSEQTGTTVLSQKYPIIANANREVYYWDYFLAGCIGGGAQLCIATPVDLIKIQLQSHIQHASIRGPRECVVHILQTNSVFGLYKGLIPQALRDIPASGFYFVIYEFFKHNLSFGKEYTKLTQFFAGGMAGTLSWWTIIPIDVIKSRMQGELHTTKYRGIIHCGTIVWRTHGVKGFFRGFLPISIRAFPVNGATFLVYECLVVHCKNL